ncbi:MAG: hypothetical protein Q8Q52_00755 [Acidimicrobiia bacterium]|nr:hypothetical protein [Acidimicrobiia bacterium]
MEGLIVGVLEPVLPAVSGGYHVAFCNAHGRFVDRYVMWSPLEIGEAEQVLDHQVDPLTPGSS